MEFLGARVSLQPRPSPGTAVELEVAMLGHCPGRVRTERLAALTGALEEIRAAGFGPRLEQLLAAGTNLYHLPLPLHSVAEFDDIFPDARVQPAQYQSRLSGNLAWLPQSVDDYFASGGRKLWIVQVPEAEGVNGFLPVFDTPLYDTSNLQAIAVVLVLQRVGLVALPDLERIQVPAELSDIPRLRLVNPDPRFLPCSSSLDDDHRERRNRKEIPQQPPSLPFQQLLQQLLALINRHRPDLQCLLTFPLAWSAALDSPCIDEANLAGLSAYRYRSDAYLLRQVQLLFPYLRNRARSLYSPVGVVAGALAGSARTRGIWRSIAGVPLSSDGFPYPPVDQVRRVAWREDPGLGILQQRNGVLTLDDERTVVPALHRNDYNGTDISARLQSLRSAEVVRFIGFIRRQLQELGESLIFDVDFRDARPRLLLEKFFDQLFRQGALRGDRAEQAYRISQRDSQDAVLALDIEIAPAYPIDKIELTLVNRDGNWFAEASNG